MSEIIFSDIKQLYERVEPALKSKLSELNRLGFDYLTKEDIWNYLQESKWKNSNDLMLGDMINDILSTNVDEINQYFINISKNQLRDVNLENIKLN